MADRFDPPRDHDWKSLPMRPDIAGQYVRYSDLAAARSEIERLKDKCSQYIEKAYDKTIEVNNLKAEIERLKTDNENLTASLAGEVTESERLRAELAGYKYAAQQLEAERDLARAWVAKAFRMAMNETAKGPGFIDRIRELTPADARAALEAYGREKMREGMKRAAELVSHSAYGTAYWAILAEMEKEASQ